MPSPGALIPGCVFLTGGTGALGRRIVRGLLERSDASISLLVRPGDDIVTPADYAATYLAGLPESSRRLRLVTGDVRAPGLGMTEATSRDLQSTVDAVLHGAAITRFDEALADCRATNVGGTGHVLQWARECPRLDRVAFLSTAYVAGRRSGVIREDELAHGVGFVNPYEQSKYEAEALLEAEGRDLPIAVYRLSTILGDSRTGTVDRYTAPHFALRLLWLGLIPMVPGDPDYPVELIPSDYAAETVSRLFLEQFAAGRRFHVAAGAERCWTLQRVIDTARETFGALSAEWGRRGYAGPSLVDVETYRLFAESVTETANPLFLRVLQQLDSFSEQLLYPKWFDTTALETALPDHFRPPPLETYFAKVLEFCLRDEWGHGRADRRADRAGSRQAV